MSPDAFERPSSSTDPVQLRTSTWVNDRTAMVVHLRDHHDVPSRDDVAMLIETARRDGYRVIRTGALFPPAAATFYGAGFHAIDTLALLERLIADDVPPPSRSGPKIKTMRSWHQEAVAELDRRAFGEFWGNDSHAIGEIRRATPISVGRFIAERGRPIAVVIVGASDETGYIQRLAVDPEHRRRGLGRELVNEALRWIQRQDLDVALVNASVDNETALSLYTGMGFRVLDTTLSICELALDGRSS